MKYPILYKSNRKWKIWVKDNVIYRTDGLTRKDFEKEPSKRVITGKSHTTDQEQALLEAKREWIKKIDKGFLPDKEDEKGMVLYEEIMKAKKSQGGNNHGTSNAGNCKKGAIKKTGNNKVYKMEPMLAFKYEEKKKRVIWDSQEKENIIKKLKPKKVNDAGGMMTLEPDEVFASTYFDATEEVYLQPKIDGIRCISLLDDGELVCLSRNNKQFVWLEKQKEEIKAFLDKNPTLTLDGEWYVHKPVIGEKQLFDAERFSFITSACKTVRNKPHPNESLIQYHVFDIIDDTLTQRERFEILESAFSKHNSKYLKFVKFYTIKSEKQMVKYHDKFFEKDYEGVILRDPSAYYSNKRSLGLLKHKYFDDTEFEIVDANKAEGTHQGAVIWVCKTENGNTFTCNMRKAVNDRKDMYKKKDKYIGKQLTVRYQGLSKDGIPRFPVGIAIRDYE